MWSKPCSMIYGQDFKAGGWNSDRAQDQRPNRWKGRGYAAFDEDIDGQWGEAYYEDDWVEADDSYSPDYEDTAFDEDAIYYGYDDDPQEDHEGFDEDASTIWLKPMILPTLPTWTPDSSSWLEAIFPSSH